MKRPNSIDLVTNAIWWVVEKSAKKVHTFKDEKFQICVLWMLLLRHYFLYNSRITPHYVSSQARSYISCMIEIT